MVPALRSQIVARPWIAFALLALLGGGCGGRSSALGTALPAADSLSAATVTNLPQQGSYCPAGTEHANLCCTTTALDLTTCQRWSDDPLRACPRGTVTNPDPERCCSLDDVADCAPPPEYPTPPLASQCNMVCPPGTTYVGPMTPPIYALPDDVCAGPYGTSGLGPPEPVGIGAGGDPGPGGGTATGTSEDAGAYSAPPFNMCLTCPSGWDADSSGILCCRTTPGGIQECVSLAYDPPSASLGLVVCTGPDDYSSATCSDVAGGHSYAMTCVVAAGEQANCTCAEDGATTMTFSTSNAVLNPYTAASDSAWSTTCGFPRGNPGGPATGSSGPAGG